MSSVYLKPLRSLLHPLVIGHVEAVRYCISTTPPLLELTDELLRLLHEALVLADNTDGTLVAKIDARKSSMEVVQLRVACLKLLTAAMPIADGFSRIPQTRQRYGIFQIDSISILSYPPKQGNRSILQVPIQLI